MSLTSKELRKKFIEYYKSLGHSEIVNSSLVPQNDTTTLFTGSGMQPLIPYLLGETHPQGTRLVDIQRCLRAEDLDEVGNTPVHDTFFEMMGNWSLGDYFKKEQINWVLDFFINEIGLDINRLYVTVFSGDGEVSKDEEAVNHWKDAFLRHNIVALEGNIYDVGKEGKENVKIFAYDRKKNWWERSGAKAGDPAGPDSEMFYDTGKQHDSKYGEFCHVNCDCRKFIEIANNVFMQYQKQADGSYIPLKAKNVDVGYGFERILMVANETPSIFETDVFLPIIRKAEELSGQKYGIDAQKDKAFKVVADHIRASSMLISDGLIPSNKEQGYMLRRLVRRALRFAKKINLERGFTKELSLVVVDLLGDAHPNLIEHKNLIVSELLAEEEKFSKALDQGLKALEHALAFRGTSDELLSGQEAFMIYETYGFPLELITDVCDEVGVKIDLKGFEKAFEEHKEKSKMAMDVKFKGGLEGTSDMHIKYHTATHLLQKALRDVLGDSVHQMGSNITTDRLRFDFSYDGKMTPEEIKAVEDIVNLKISQKLPVNHVDLPKEEAEKTGALHFFGEKYGQIIRVYYIGDSLESAFSKEFCGGPHVENIGDLGTFKIQKEESSSRGVRRIKAVLV